MDPARRSAFRATENATARRTQVLEATLAVIAREGLDNTSLRAIAQELGCTTGVLTHYFRDKEDLLDFVFQSLLADLGADAQRIAAGEVTVADIPSVCALVLPNSGRARTSWQIWLAFTAASFDAGRFAEGNRALYQRLRTAWAGLFRTLREHGAVRADLDPEREAVALIALVDGLALQALIDGAALPPERSLSILEAHIARLRPDSRPG